MDLTREQALKLHREMWSDMQKKLGDNPNKKDRALFKMSWCSAHFPEEIISSCCFLCQYTESKGLDCDYCPIDWTGGGFSCNTCLSFSKDSDYRFAPISKILALPERKVEE